MAPDAARTGGRPRDPQADSALVEAVLDLVDGGATLSGLSLVTIARHACVSRNSLYRRWRTKDALYMDVLASINKPLPPVVPEGSARDRIVAVLGAVIERTLDRRASHMLRALNAEAAAFPELHARYFAEIVGPRRDVMNRAIAGGVASGEIRADVDPDLVTDLLVSPILAKMAAGATAELDPDRTAREITDLVLQGAQRTGAQPGPRPSAT